MARHHLILGAGPAGVIAAESLRKLVPQDRVTLVGDEPELPYSRMAIPYLLMGSIDERGTLLRKDPHHYEALGIERVQARATSVDAGKRLVELSNGEVIRFDCLLIATGSLPVRFPIPGFDGANVHPCWTLADAREIVALAQPGAKVVQMGAGFIGCIIMEALASRGVSLTVVEMGDRMVPRMMGATAGAMIKSWCESKGVTVITGAKVERIDHADGLSSKVCLSTGVKIEADLVISATGVKPNVAFLQGSGIEVQTGVLTDTTLQTNCAGIYAAGDCAQAFDRPSQSHLVSAIQPNAADEALVAARNMAGQHSMLQRVPQINVLDTLGLISSSFGQWQGVPGGDHVEMTDWINHRMLGLQFEGDRLIGCNAIGWTEHVGVMRGLVEGQVRLGPWKDKLMKDPTRLMEAYLACAQAQEQHAVV
jgi:NADPH-dependent 2,4-dienoyl-CoA reductase/sulfur reductase-like enzyme